MKNESNPGKCTVLNCHAPIAGTSYKYCSYHRGMYHPGASDFKYLQPYMHDSWPLCPGALRYDRHGDGERVLQMYVKDDNWTGWRDIPVSD